MLGRPVSPRDCALALAIPLTEAQFLADLDEAAPKDLAKSLRRRIRLRGPVLYETQYRPLVTLAAAVAEEAHARGVTVYRGVRLADVPSVLAAHRAVTLVAHWRFLLLDDRDVLDVASFQARLASSESAADAETHLEARRPVDTFLRDDPAIRAAAAPAELAAALNRLMLPSRDYYQWAPSVGGPPPAEAGGLTRVLLEEMYPACFAHGLCLELADRLCTAWEFIDQVGDAFDGVLDLTVCNSLILAEALHRRRPSCTALCNTNPATAEVRLVIYRHVIRSLSKAAEPFEDVMARAHASLIRQIRRLNEPA